MDQAQEDLKAVIATKAAAAEEAADREATSRASQPPIRWGCHLESQVTNSDEGDDIVTLNPKLLTVPATVPDSFLSFETSEESPRVEDIEEPLIMHGSPITSTTSGGVIPDLPSVFPTISPASESRVSVPLHLLAFLPPGVVSLL